MKICELCGKEIDNQLTFISIFKEQFIHQKCLDELVLNEDLEVIYLEASIFKYYPLYNNWFHNHLFVKFNYDLEFIIYQVISKVSNVIFINNEILTTLNKEILVAIDKLLDENVLYVSVFRIDLTKYEELFS